MNDSRQTYKGSLNAQVDYYYSVLRIVQYFEFAGTSKQSGGPRIWSRLLVQAIHSYFYYEADLLRTE